MRPDARRHGRRRDQGRAGRRIAGAQYRPVLQGRAASRPLAVLVGVQSQQARDHARPRARRRPRSAAPPRRARGFSDRVAQSRLPGEAQSRFRRPRENKSGAHLRFDHAVRTGRPQGDLRRQRSDHHGGWRTADSRRRRGSPAGAALRSAGVPARMRRRGGGRTRGSSRAHALRPRATHRCRGGPIGCDGDAVEHSCGGAGLG